MQIKIPRDKVKQLFRPLFSFCRKMFSLLVAKEPFVRTLLRSCECYKSFTASFSILLSVSVMNTESSVLSLSPEP